MIIERKILELKNGFAFMDADGFGRYIGKDGEAFDLDPKKHHELIARVLAKGKSAVSQTTKPKEYHQLGLLENI